VNGQIKMVTGQGKTDPLKAIAGGAQKNGGADSRGGSQKSGGAAGNGGSSEKKS